MSGSRREWLLLADLGHPSGTSGASIPTAARGPRMAPPAPCGDCTSLTMTRTGVKGAAGTMVCLGSQTESPRFLVKKAPLAGEGAEEEPLVGCPVHPAGLHGERLQ